MVMKNPCHFPDLCAIDAFSSSRSDGVNLATLSALVEHSGQVVSKDRLMELIWPDSFVEEGNLSFNVCVLRRALGERPHEHRYVVAGPGEGYRFVASVKPIESGDTVSDTAALREEPASPGGALRLNSSFYITRPTDERFQEAIQFLPPAQRR